MAKDPANARAYSSQKVSQALALTVTGSFALPTLEANALLRIGCKEGWDPSPLPMLETNALLRTGCKNGEIGLGSGFPVDAWNFFYQFFVKSLSIINKYRLILH